MGNINEAKIPRVLWFLLAYLSIIYGVSFFVEESTMRWLVKEDGIIEYFGALSFFVASVLFFWLFLKTNDGNNFIFFSTKRNVFYLLLALLFFFIFGEEISWGQRIFGIETPEAIRGQNIQQELNFHNLKIFNSVDEENVKRPWYDIFAMSRLFRIFWFSFTLVVPVLNSTSRRFSSYFKQFNLPILPIWLGLLFLVNYLISKIMVYILTPEIRFVEIEESSHGLFFVVAAAWIIAENRVLSRN